MLADGNGNPRLGDFGLSRMMEKDLSLWQTSATQAPGTTRWKAVELMTGDQATVSVPGDIWAYAMTSLVRSLSFPIVIYPTKTGTNDGRYALLTYKERNGYDSSCGLVPEATVMGDCASCWS